MLLAQRRLWWFASLLGLFAGCNDETVPNTVVPTPTSVIISPEAFLGSAVCGSEQGGLLAYQATVLDVTDGLTGAPSLPSSSVVDCTSTVVFETVEIDHRYAAIITAYDREGLRAESEGSQTVVDGDGNEVLPKWTTLCTGHDGEIDQALGGAGGVGEGTGGEGGAVNTSLGVRAREHAAVPILGCAPLSGDFDPNLTGVRVDPVHFLGDLACGDAEGAVFDYSVELLTESEAAGGAGGAGGMGSGDPMDDRLACDVPFTARGLAPNQWVTMEVWAFEAGAETPSWSTTCEARPMLGALTAASCDRLRPF